MYTYSLISLRVACIYLSGGCYITLYIFLLLLLFSNGKCSCNSSKMEKMKKISYKETQNLFLTGSLRYNSKREPVLENFSFLFIFLILFFLLFIFFLFVRRLLSVKSSTLCRVHEAEKEIQPFHFVINFRRKNAKYTHVKFLLLHTHILHVPTLISFLIFFSFSFLFFISHRRETLLLFHKEKYNFSLLL